MSNNHRSTTGGGNTTNSGYYHTTPQPFVPPQFRPQQQTSLSAETTPTAPPPPPYNPDHSQHQQRQQNQQQPFVPTAYAVAEPYNPYAQQQQPPPPQQPLPPHQQHQQPFVVPAAAYQQATATTSYQAEASSVSSSLHHPPPARPSLSNPTAWFEHYDRDGSGTLNREEVVSALIDTCGVTVDYQQRSLRETVYSIWTVFDHNDNGSIDKREFSAAGGLGESLQAMMQSQFQSTSSCDDHRPSAPPAAPHSCSAPTAPVVATATATAAPAAAAAVQASAPAMAAVVVPAVAATAAAGPAAEWSCPACTFSNPATNHKCAMCDTPRGGGGTSYHPQQQQQQRPAAAAATTTQQQRQTQTIRVGIAAGMRAGQKIKVPTPDGGSRTETIPDSSRWVYMPTGQAAFDIEVPVMRNRPVVINGTYVTQQQQYQQQSSSSQPPPPQWQRYEDIVAASYQPPALGLQDVPYRAEGVPSYLNPFQPSGRRRALVIGINYTGTRAALRGCVNDANNVKRLLVRSGYPDDSSHMVVLTDESVSGGHGFRNAAGRHQYSPTYENIRRGMRWLVQGVAAGDVLFFHFSGHGAQVPDRTGHETDGLNETILPVDYRRRQITDDELWGTMVYPLPAGTKLTALMDCCHSGTGLDLPFEYRMDTGRTKNRYGLGKPYHHRRANGAGQWIEDVNPAHSQGDVVLFSGCEDHQTSADACDARQAGGAMTQSFLTAYEENPLATYPDFLRAVHAALKRRRFKQRPQLTSSQPFAATERVFSLTEGIESNRNAKIGRVKNRHVRPGRVNGGGAGAGPMDALLLGGVGVLGALAIGEMLF